MDALSPLQEKLKNLVNFELYKNESDILTRCVSWHLAICLLSPGIS